MQNSESQNHRTTKHFQNFCPIFLKEIIIMLIYNVVQKHLSTEAIRLKMFYLKGYKSAILHIYSIQK